ncbi:MAG: hypothetical protein K9L26_01705 [Candidatus Izimaplasma sp.]|nr:hypothetical protein [Candidatus Izimaplasma bacterium]
MTINRIMIAFGAVIAIIVMTLTLSYETEKTEAQRIWYGPTYQFVDGHMLYRKLTMNYTCLGTNVNYTLLFQDGNTIYLTNELVSDDPCLETYYIKEDGEMMTLAQAQLANVVTAESLLDHTFKVEIIEAYNFVPLHSNVTSFRTFTMDNDTINLGETYTTEDSHFETVLRHITDRPFWDETKESSTLVESIQVSFSNGDTRTFHLYSDYIVDDKTGYVAYFDDRFMK